MSFIGVLFFSWNLYQYLGIAHKAYSVYNYGRDGYKIMSKIKWLFTRNKKKEPELTDSFLIEKEDVENNWELIKIFKFN